MDNDYDFKNIKYSGAQFGDILREERKRRKLTLREMAKDLDISYSTLGKYERNENEPDIKTLKKIADYLEISTDYLLGFSQIRKSNRSVLIPHQEDLLERIFMLEDNSEEQRLCYSILKNINILLEEYLIFDESFDDNIVSCYSKIIHSLTYLNVNVYNVLNSTFKPKKPISQDEICQEIKRIFLSYKYSVDKKLDKLFECYLEKFAPDTKHKFAPDTKHKIDEEKLVH